MSEIMTYTYEFFQAIIQDITFEKVVIITVAYMIIHSETTLGFILRVLLLWVVISTFRMNYNAYGLYHGIKSSGILAIAFYWPLAVKLVFKVIKSIVRGVQ